jgi:hypothetical protein
VESLRSEREAAKRGAVNGAAIKREVRREPEPETNGVAIRHASEAQPEVKPEVKPETKKPKTAHAQRRTRPARQAPPAETTHYAQQPFANYQPMY